VRIYGAFMPGCKSLATLRRGVAYRRRLRFVKPVDVQKCIPIEVVSMEKPMDALYIALLIACGALTAWLVAGLERLRKRS
jgi:hypothetical protein